MLRGNGPGPRPTTLLRAGLAAVTVASALLVLAPRRPRRHHQADAEGGHVAVIEVSGLLDEVLVDFVETQIDARPRRTVRSPSCCSSTAPAPSSSDARLDALVEPHRVADVPVDVWVGPSGSQAIGDATALLAAARTVGVAGGSRVEITPVLLGDGTLDGEAAVGDKVSAGDAVDLGLVDNAAPTIGLFVYGEPPGEGLPGADSTMVDGQRQPVTQTRFAQLPLGGQLLHTVASPPVAYLLFVIGLALIVFELYTAGVGVAGLVGAGCLILGCYGLASLPTNLWAVGLLLFAMFGFAIDVQTGVPRVWSGIATASLGHRVRAALRRPLPLVDHAGSWPSAASPLP